MHAGYTLFLVARNVALETHALPTAWPGAPTAWPAAPTAWPAAPTAWPA